MFKLLIHWILFCGMKLCVIIGLPTRQNIPINSFPSVKRNFVLTHRQRTQTLLEIWPEAKNKNTKQNRKSADSIPVCLYMLV